MCDCPVQTAQALLEAHLLRPRQGDPAWQAAKAALEVALASQILSAAAAWKAEERPRVHRPAPRRPVAPPPPPAATVTRSGRVILPAGLMPEEILAAKVERLRTMGPEGRRRAAYIRWEMRALCEAEGLPVPPEIAQQPRGGDNRRAR